MSNIFDALQRSELERSDGNRSTLTLATELLEAAEQKVRGSGALVEEPVSRASVESLDSLPASPASAGPLDPPAATGLEELDRCPVLPISIPPDSRLVSLGQEGSLGAEKFRFLAVRLRQLRQSRPLKKVLITSTIPEEGKSTVAANLACTLARRKPRRTLLLEGDLRRPSISSQFGLSKLTGLCEWLSGQSPKINIYRLQDLGVWLLPAGSAPENPLELMQSGRLSPLMEQLESSFDWIVIDSPPILPLADTSVWSRMADGILLVTRTGITNKQELRRGVEALEKSKLLGALVNSSSNAAHSDYYQRYGYSLSPDIPPKNRP